MKRTQIAGKLVVQQEKYSIMNRQIDEHLLNMNVYKFIYNLIYFFSFLNIHVKI